MDNPESYNDYDLEPVTYCSKCYSLKIKYEESIDTDCCMDCGSSDTQTTTIDKWEELYEKRYGHKYAEKSNDPKKSIIFNMPIGKLKAKVFEEISWRKIITSLYPKFPGGLGKADSIILFFDKATKDRKLDDLRLLLYNLNKNKVYGRKKVEQQDEGYQG